MFETRDLPADVDAVREAYAPDAIVLDAAADFETIPPAAAEDLGLLVDALDPATYPSEWVPDDAPSQLLRLAGSDFTIGMPGDGTVVWTRQTEPPIVIAKRRAETTPDDFLDFLLAEAFVELGVESPSSPTGDDAIPDGFLPFFGDRYRELDEAVPLGPAEVYQVANALYDAWVGLHTRPEFESWADDPDLDRLYDAWEDAGQRLTGRLDELPKRVARGETDFADATEFACAAIKHELDLPAPFAALNTSAYREHGAEYGVRWAKKTFEQLDVDDD